MPRSIGFSLPGSIFSVIAPLKVVVPLTVTFTGMGATATLDPAFFTRITKGMALVELPQVLVGLTISVAAKSFSR